MSSHAASLVFGHVELRLAERCLLVDGHTVALGSRGFDLLKALVSQRDRVVSKNELLDQVWPGLVVEENNLQVQISGLRRVLGPNAITTVSGLGYRFTLASGPSGLLAPLDQTATPLPRGLGFSAASNALAPADVLVADDNKVNRLLLCRSLEMMGHRVRSAENGRQALDMLRQQRFALLLLDIAMPELDGFGLLEVRAGEAALREVSVIVTSALDGVAPVARCIELGADDFLHKPVDPWLLKARVESSLARQQAQDLQRATVRRLSPGAPRQASHIRDASVLLVELHQLDDLAATVVPQDAMDVLGDWATLILDAIASQDGEVCLFSGDSVTALFSQAQAAVQAAQDIVALAAQFNATRTAAGLPHLAYGVGVARGPVLAGPAFTGQRVAYACLGAPVQRAQQLADRCSALGHAVLMDAAVPQGLAANPALESLSLPSGEVGYTLAL